jgi:hypothetical protein
VSIDKWITGGPPTDKDDFFGVDRVGYFALPKGAGEKLQAEMDEITKNLQEAMKSLRPMWAIPGGATVSSADDGTIYVYHAPDVVPTFSVSMEIGDPVPGEHSCRQCGKMNDAGIKSCWWCECSSPTSRP